MTLVFFGCTSPEPSTDGAIEPPTEEPWREDTWIGTTDENGTLEVPIDVAEGEDALMVVAERGRGYLSTLSLTDPEGLEVFSWQDWVGDLRLTHAAFLTAKHTTLNWPPRTEDGPLVPGTWTAALMAYTGDDEAAVDEELEVTVMRRRASETAILPVHLAFAGGLETNTALTDAAEAAVERWQALYDPVGVTLEVTWGTVAREAQLPYAYDGDPLYEELHASLDPRSVLVVVGDQITITGYYGECPANPGPFAPTQISAVEIAWTFIAGGDGAFSDSDLDLFAVTLAHEVGHYLGLFHAVQLTEGSGAAPDTWDALSDTGRCRTYDGCVEELGSNLMFPFPLCDEAGCVPGTELSDEQGAVLRGWLGVQ